MASRWYEFSTCRDINMSISAGAGKGKYAPGDGPAGSITVTRVYIDR